MTAEWARVLKAADACNNAPWHRKIDMLKRYSRACLVARAADAARKAKEKAK